MSARWLAALILAATSLASATASAASQVTCVGDSITVGFGTSNEATKSYPAQLQGLLGASYAVENDGHNGATLLTTGDLPYNATPEYTRSTATALANGGDVVIQLGTNDTRPQNWAHKATFEKDCEALVAHYLAPAKGGTPPRVWVSLPPPVFGTNPWGIDGAVMTNEVNALVKQCAAAKGVSTIDVYSALQPFRTAFVDGVHPNDDGAGKLAQAVRDALVKRPTISIAATTGAVTSTATAAYGKVQSVEIFEGATSIGKSTAPPFTVSITGLGAGAHTLTGRVTETGGRTADSAPIQVAGASANGVPSASATASSVSASGGCNVARGDGFGGTGVIVGLLAFLRRRLRSKK